MMVKLKQNQFDYLDYSLSEKQKSLYLKIQAKKKGQFIFVEVDNDTADEIRDWAMDEQVNIGFDKNYELTPEGKILEELIEAFHMR